MAAHLVKRNVYVGDILHYRLAEGARRSGECRPFLVVAVQDSENGILRGRLFALDNDSPRFGPEHECAKTITVTLGDSAQMGACHMRDDCARERL